MEIPECGYDCKGKQYQKKEIGKIKDLTGQVFTYLTPLFRVEGQRTSWLCKCKCGNIIVEQANHLVENTVKSCGCYNKEQAKQRRTLDYQGQQFGELTVLERVERETTRSHSALLKCRCSCGKITLVSDVNLITGNTKSCGHLRLLHHGTQSKGAKYIEELLKQHHIQYKTEYSFDDLRGPKNGLLRFDFAIFNSNNQLQCLIEFDGAQHYQEIQFFSTIPLEYRQQCDQLKNNYCKQHRIPLYRIPYYKLDDLQYKNLFSKQFLL